MRLRAILVAITLAIGGAIALPRTAAAHALPQSSVPAEGSTVQPAPGTVAITFGETPDPNLSSINVVNSSGTNIDAGASHAVAGHPLELEVPLQAHLPNGVYTVTWKTVSAVDGHLATGSFAFGVGVSAGSVPAASAGGGATPPSVLAVLMRLLLFTGLVVVVGAVVLGAFAFGTPTPLLRRVIAVGAVVGVVGTVGVVGAQVLTAGVSLGELLGSSLARSLIARAIPASILLASALVLVSGRWPSALGILAAAAALVAMGVDVLNSHAAGENPVTLNELTQWLHIAAVGVWIGGLVALLVCVLGPPSDLKTHLTHRLSTLAGVGLVVVAATGVFRAVIEVQTWGNLVSTAFGVLVLLKIGLIAILAALGAVNRFGNLPRLPRALHALKRAVSTEILVGLGALTVAAALVNVAPPAEYAAAAASSAPPASLVASGSDYATTVKVTLTATPGVAGFNIFNVNVSDYNTGVVFAASRILLQFTQPLRPQLGESNLTLTRQTDGTFQARGGNLSLDGIWEVAAIIENGGQSTEVHLQLTTIEPTPAVTITRFNGLPTLYTIQASKGRTVQVYLDPDKSGADQFHATFLGADGNELPMAHVTLGMTSADGMPTILTSRRLDNIGHFVADATVTAGKTRFDIIGTTPTGEVLSTYINITPGS